MAAKKSTPPQQSKPQPAPPPRAAAPPAPNTSSGGSGATPAVAGPPRGQFGNRLDTAAGAKKEAQMAAAAAALRVAHSEAVYGRGGEAQKALDAAFAALDPGKGGAMRGMPINEQFANAVNRDAANIRAIMNKKPEGPQGPTGGGDNNETFSASLAAYAPPPNPTPVLPVFTEDKTSTFKNVKVAPKDTIVFNESDVNIALMQDLLFEDIAAIELANMSRYDLIDGQEVFYSPIKNLSTIKRRFDPNNIIATAINNKTSYAIDLNSRIGSGIYEGKTKGVPSLDNSGNVFFYIDGLKPGEIVEIQLVSSGTIDEIGD